MNLASRLWWGLRTGVAIGALLSALSIIIYILGGESTFEKLNTTLPDMLFAYLAGGVCGGVICGLLLPLARRRSGAALVGFATMLPGIAFVMLARGHRGAWSMADVSLALILALVLGGPLGADAWRDVSATRTNKPE